MLERLTRWFIFSVLVTMVPLGFSFARRATEGQLATLNAVISHGELLLISVATCAVAIGELIASGSRRSVLQVLAAGGCVITLISASLYFAYVSSTTSPNAEVVTRTSVWIFAFGLLASAFCIMLAEKQ